MGREISPFFFHTITMARKKIKKKVIQIPKDNIEKIDNLKEKWNLPDFRFKKIPKELIPAKPLSLVYYIGHLYGDLNIGILKNINEKEKYCEIKTIQSKYNDRIGVYDINAVMLVPEGSKDYKKYERYIND